MITIFQIWRNLFDKNDGQVTNDKLAPGSALLVKLPVLQSVWNFGFK